MSGWDEHLNYIMVRPEKSADKAALIYFSAAPGSRVVAATPDFTISDEEIDVLVKIYETDTGKNNAYGNGFDVAGEHYKVLKIEDRSLYGKLGRTGVSIAKTASLIIVAHYDEKIQAGNNVLAVEGLADHLVKSGY